MLLLCCASLLLLCTCTLPNRWAGVEQRAGLEGWKVQGYAVTHALGAMLWPQFYGSRSWAGTPLCCPMQPAFLCPLYACTMFPPPLPLPGCSDGETEDIGEMAGDLDAMADVDLGAVNFAGFPPQALPWAAPPVQGPGAAGDGVGGGEGSSSEDGGDSGSDSDESEGGESSSSDGGSTSSGSGGEAMDEDEEDEWFPGGDAGAY